MMEDCPLSSSPGTGQEHTATTKYRLSSTPKSVIGFLKYKEGRIMLAESDIIT
jgi:hypothetical protein